MSFYQRISTCNLHATHAHACTHTRNTYIFIDPACCSSCTTLHHTAPHCTTLQHTATHCTTLYHTATHCNTLQHTATRCNTLQHAATLCNSLQHTAAHRSTLQHTTPHCNTLSPGVEPRGAVVCWGGESRGGAAESLLKNNKTLCNILQRCYSLRHTAAHCNTLQHTAIHHHRGMSHGGAQSSLSY